MCLCTTRRKVIFIAGDEGRRLSEYGQGRPEHHESCATLVGFYDTLRKRVCDVFR